MGLTSAGVFSSHRQLGVADSSQSEIRGAEHNEQDYCKECGIGKKNT